MLENCRFNKGEKKDDEALARKMAALCDVYVNDAFGTAHRAEATTHGIARFAKVACAGPLMAAELDALGKALADPERPLVAIVGGSKVSTKLTMLGALAEESGQPDRRRRHRQHLPAGRRQADRQIARRARPGRRGEAHHRRRPKVPLPDGRGGARSRSATPRASVKAVGRGGRRRNDPRHRPGQRRGAGGRAEESRHHRLERAGRRVRDRAVRQGHRNARAGDRRLQGVLDRRRRRHASPRSTSSASTSASATSPPPAAHSSSSSKARRCPAVAALEARADG